VLGERNWYRSKRLLIPTMLVACFFVVLVSWLASYLSRELALFIFAVLTTALVFLGSLVLTKFTFGILLARNNRSKG
jgi:hypothetical protein